MTSQKDRTELTGNPFVDTGLATIATLGNCKTIDDLTLRKMKRVHSDGSKLARYNSRLKSMPTIFTINSSLTNPSFKDKKKQMKVYATITTGILNNIGHEARAEICEMCGNPYSIDLNEVCKRVDKNGGNTAKYIGRDWFPLTGSIVNDAQCLPSGSRPLNCCAKCLFAVQYLPQSVMSTKGGLLTLFQSTSTKFWYQIVRSITNDIRARLSAGGRVEILGYGKEERGFVVVINKLLDIMQTMKLDPGTFLTMWQFKNGGNSADCQIDEIPNFALTFLDKAIQHGLREEIMTLISKEKNFGNSLFNSITNRRDYLPQYSSKRRGSDGVSPEFFLLYQNHIRNYPAKCLRSAYNIAQYVINSKLDSNNKKYNNFGVDIDSKEDRGQRTKVRAWIVDMVKEGKITFDEYYDLFVAISRRNMNPWSLIKYYLLKPDVTQFRLREEGSSIEHKNVVIDIGTRLFNSLMDRKKERFRKEVLERFAGNKISESWLRRQFEILTDESKGEFGYVDNWNRLCRNGINVYEILYLLRLLFTSLFFQKTSDATLYEKAKVRK